MLLMAREMGPGGTERQLAELAKALDRRSFEPHVAFFREGFRSAELRDAGIDCICLGVHSFLTPLALSAGGIALWIQSRRRVRASADQDDRLLRLTPDEEARLDQLIATAPLSEK